MRIAPNTTMRGFKASNVQQLRRASAALVRQRRCATTFAAENYTGANIASPRAGHHFLVSRPPPVAAAAICATGLSLPPSRCPSPLNCST